MLQITQHKWAWPFMQPVDVEALGLRDYYEVVLFSISFAVFILHMFEFLIGMLTCSILKLGKGSFVISVRKHIRGHRQARLVFSNAMKYNDDKSDVHGMAKTLLEKFEEKWLQFAPRVTEDEKRREEEEAEALLSLQRAQEAAHAKMARDLSNELYETDMRLEELREIVVKKCRFVIVISSPILVHVCIYTQTFYDPVFYNLHDTYIICIMQSESTLWRLKYFVKDALYGQSKNDAPCEVSNEANVGPIKNVVSKRKMQLCNALAKTAKKRNQKG
ncbi:transcription factor GTE1-like [Bidens hawaiensis]|uniref:transcription factor GTE1-like n=1 Tax=Bidens hawaiensis TaxID=980011 RepID=UPI00404AC102